MFGSSRSGGFSDSMTDRNGTVENVPSETCWWHHRRHTFYIKCFFFLFNFCSLRGCLCCFSLTFGSLLHNWLSLAICPGLIAAEVLTCEMSGIKARKRRRWLWQSWLCTTRKKREGEKGWRIKSCLMGFLTLFLSEHKGIPETLAAPPFFFLPWITSALVKENLACWADLPTSCTSDGFNVMEPRGSCMHQNTDGWLKRRWKGSWMLPMSGFSHQRWNPDS